MFPAKIRKACTAKPHWANIRSTLQNGRSSVCAFICIRLTSAFWLPFAPSPCNREQVGKRKDKTKKKKEERPNYFSRRETDWKKVCSFLLSFSLPLLFFPFFFLLCLSSWQSTVLLRWTTKALSDWNPFPVYANRTGQGVPDWDRGRTKDSYGIPVALKPTALAQHA